MGGNAAELPETGAPESRRRRKAFALGAVTVAALALGAGAALAGRTVTIGASSNGKSLSLKKGDTLVVRLAGNLTTGYRWDVAQLPGSLRKLGSSYATRKATPPMPGQGGTFVLRFAARSGHGALRLVYHRPWEKQTLPLKTFTVRVDVD